MQWHELMAALLRIHFENSPFEVEAEVDLSLKKQFLDILVVRKLPGDFAGKLPDGFEPMADHNLISFKSLCDTFDGWALLELLSHFVVYRKQVSSANDKMLPMSSFRLIGIASRFPDLLAKEVELKNAAPGVYDIPCGPIWVRMLVIRELREQTSNRVLKFFSPVPTEVENAVRNYRPDSDFATSIVSEMLNKYRKENVDMSQKMDEIFRRLKETSERVFWEGVTVQDVLEHFPAEKLVESIPPEERVKGLPPEERVKGLPPEELVKGLSIAEVEELLKKMKAE